MLSIKPEKWEITLNFAKPTMSAGLYMILTVVVAVASIIYGFSRGITGQISYVLGFAFGAVAARVLTPVFLPYFDNPASLLSEDYYRELAATVFCAATVYVAVFLLFSLTTRIFRGALSVFDVGMFNRLVGAFFSLTAGLMFLSIAFTLLLCTNPDCGLLSYETSDDGNLAAAVMDLMPAVLGCPGADELAHLVQLKQAASISCNFNAIPNVIIIKSAAATLPGVALA